MVYLSNKQQFIEIYTSNIDWGNALWKVLGYGMKSMKTMKI